MDRNTVLTLIVVVICAVIAWWLVGVIFSAVWFLLRLAVALVIGLILYVVIRRALRNRNRT